jgi:1-acyl-sn-glycerol-3-phosphate acyltransferase
MPFFVFKKIIPTNLEYSLNTAVIKKLNYNYIFKFLMISFFFAGITKSIENSSNIPSSRFDTVPFFIAA